MFIQCRYDTKNTRNKIKIGKLNFFEAKKLNFFVPNYDMKNMKRTHRMEENICKSYISDNRLIKNIKRTFTT